MSKKNYMGGKKTITIKGLESVPGCREADPGRRIEKPAEAMDPGRTGMWRTEDRTQSQNKKGGDPSGNKGSRMVNVEKIRRFRDMRKRDGEASRDHV